MTYYSSSLLFDLAFICKMGIGCTLNYSIDGIDQGSPPMHIDQQSMSGPYYVLLWSFNLPQLSEGSHQLSIGEEEIAVNFSQEDLPSGIPFQQITVTNGSRYVASWIDTVYFTIDTSHTPTSAPSPTPVPKHVIAIISDGNGMVTPSGNQTWEEGSSHMIDVTPSDGYFFDGWIITNNCGTFLLHSLAPSPVFVVGKTDGEIHATFHGYITIAPASSPTLSPSPIQTPSPSHAPSPSTTLAPSLTLTQSPAPSPSPTQTPTIESSPTPTYTPHIGPVGYPIEPIIFILILFLTIAVVIYYFEYHKKKNGR